MRTVPQGAAVFYLESRFFSIGFSEAGCRRLMRVQPLGGGRRTRLKHLHLPYASAWEYREFGLPFQRGRLRRAREKGTGWDRSLLDIWTCPLFLFNVWDNCEVADNYDNLRHTGSGVVDGALKAFGGSVGEQVGVGKIADAVSGQAASNEKLGVAGRVTHGVLGLAEVTLNVLGAKAAVKGAKVVGRVALEGAEALWDAAKGFFFKGGAKEA
jgi:hypothetical protein